MDADVLARGDEETSADEDVSSAPATSPPLGSVGALPVATHLGEWVYRGPKNYGGKVHDVAIDPLDANTAFAAYGCYSDLHSTNGTGAGLWRTRNGGRFWQPVIPADEDPCVLSVDVHQQQSNFVVAGLRGSALNRHPSDVLLSRDRGDTWQSIGPPSSDHTLSVFAVKFDIADPNTVYAATHKGLFKTINSGRDWNQVLDYTGTGFWPDAPTLAMHPSDPGTLLLAVRSLGVQRTTNGGDCWVRVDDAMDQTEPITVLAWARSNPNVVYAERISPRRDSGGHHNQMFTYKSSDTGLSWSRTVDINGRHQNRYDMGIAVDPSDEDHVIVGNTSMVYSSDGLRTTPLSPERSVHADQLTTVFAPSNPRIVYNGNDGGLWKSIDGGITWRRADWGVRSNHISSLGVYPSTGIINLSAADYGAIAYDPQDPQEGGWHNSDCGGEYRANHINPNDPELAYYGGGGTTPLTLVGNATRDCLNIDPAPNESRAGHIPMAFHPTDANTIYAGLGHLWKSTDNGATWATIGIEEVFQAGKHIKLFQVAPSEARTLYAFTNLNNNLWATHDGGKTWSQPYTFAAPRAVAVMPGDESTLYVGTDMGTDDRHGLFRSNDGGAHFEKLTAVPNNLPINKLLIDPENPARVLVATGRGMLLTDDSGASWARLGRDLPAGIVVDASLVGRTLYATSDQGLWSMELNGLGACAQPVMVLPRQVSMGSAGGRVRLDISIVPSCAWSAQSSADWAEIESYGQGRGPAVIDVLVRDNPGGAREAVLTVAGQPIPLEQFGGADPIAADAVITFQSGKQCVTSEASDVVDLKPCDPASADQRFRLEPIRPLLYHVVTASDKCLDTRKTRVAGTRLRQDRCMGEEEAHQFFEFLPDKTGWRLRGNLVGRTLGPEGYTLMCQERSGDHLEQQLCSSSPMQRFQISAFK